MDIKRLLKGIGLVLVLQAALNLVKYFAEIGDEGRFGPDFLFFWHAAVQAIQGHVSSIYEIALLKQTQDLLAVYRIISTGPFANPPHMLLLIWPLGHIGYNAAVALWSLLPALFYFLLAKAYLERKAPGGAVPPYPLACAFLLPFVLVNVFTGQTGAVTGTLFLLTALYWRRAPLIAGVAIGLLTIKPQLGLLLPFALLADRNWRALIAASLTAAAMVAATTFWLGTTVWTDYYYEMQLFGDYIAQGSERYNQLSLSPYVSLHGIGVSPSIATFFQLAITLLVIAVIISAFRNRKGQDDWRFGLLTCGTLLTTPYGLCYDSPLLALAVLPLLVRAWREHAPDLYGVLALGALVAMPYAEPLFYPYHVPFGLLALLAAFLVLYGKYVRESTDTAYESRRVSSST